MKDSKFRVLCYLISHSKNGICFPSIRTIAKDLHKGTGTIVQILEELESDNILIKENRFLGTGKKTSNLYTINKEYITDYNKKLELNISDEEIYDYDWINEEDWKWKR